MFTRLLAHLRPGGRRSSWQHLYREADPSQVPAWVAEARATIPRWLDQIRCKERPFGRFPFAVSGCLEREDFFASCFATTVYKALGLFATLGEAERQEWIAYLQSRQDPATGRVTCPEPWARDAATNEDRSARSLAVRTQMTGRWMNRALRRELGAAPLAPVIEPSVEPLLDWAALRDRIESYPWRNDPWAAGARSMHDIGYMLLNLSAGDERYRAPIKRGVEYILAKQDQQTGLFGGENASLYNRLNGAFKVYYYVYPILGLPMRHPEKIVDAVFNTYADREFIAGGCNDYDALFLLHMAQEFTTHRRAEAQALAASRLLALKRFWRGDGAFSYSDPTGITHLWGKQVIDRPRRQSDLHGTYTTVAALQHTLGILGLAGPLGVQHSWDYGHVSPFEESCWGRTV